MKKDNLKARKSLSNRQIKPGILGLLLVVGVLFNACQTAKPRYVFNEKEITQEPDYSDLYYWAAHPEKYDLADTIAASSSLADPNKLEADVFFIHPTTYTGYRNEKKWNADITDSKVNDRTDASTIMYQASIFNEAGRVYAPRYRQAHIFAYYTKDKRSAKEAFDLAYKDVKAAFDYYMSHYNKGRPVIIASHSQGTQHAVRLIQEYFDGTAMQQQLVAAYLIGMPVLREQFEYIEPCQNASDTGCYVSWRTFKYGFEPKRVPIGDSVLVTNPLTWSMDKNLVPSTFNEGGIVTGMQHVYPNLADAQIHKGILWTHKPKFKGSFLFLRRNYHVGDLNLYYFNVKNNAKLRLQKYLNR